MAWVRTCTSMIAFGFGIYQFLQYLSTKEQLRQPLVSPQLFAVLLIVVGLTALGLAWLQHRQAMRALRTEFGQMPYSIAGVTAAFIAGLGVIALLGVALRV
jgi:putative membrane protein